ncbi:alpha/beta fold hydrolase [Rhodococcus sp. IEGM1428]|uniref:alpha/beta fold hydrolase n=1 Tax=Rhodococcus sp. IEGM1428 TaxID=3392191 RepID=UPI003D0C9193
MFDSEFDLFTVPVAGGDLTVGRWGTGPRTILALHGVTANHACFHALADELGDDFTLLAPDLRGRGGSRDVEGPYGMTSHADDVATVIDMHAQGPVTVVGHSMGGFVAAVLSARYPELVAEVVLVDGGLPLDLGPLAALPIEDLISAVIGPAMDRLSTTYLSRDDYIDFWRAHPAMADDWSPYFERYFDTDLIADVGGFRSSCKIDAVVADTESDMRGETVPGALRTITQPVLFLRAPRGLQNDQSLYAEDVLDTHRDLIPHMQFADIDDVNHYSIVLGKGAGSVASAVRRFVAADVWSRTATRSS